jgi:hypothetical protein
MTTKFDANQLFNSLSLNEQARITLEIHRNSLKRDEERYTRLAEMDSAKNKLAQELDETEYEIAENDDWFISAKEGGIKPARNEFHLRISKAERLYSRKRMLIDQLLPNADAEIRSAIAQMESEESRESVYQKYDLERLLMPYYQKLAYERIKIVAAEARERRRQEEEDDAREQRKYDELLARLRAEELEKVRMAEENLRKIRADSIRAQVEERKIPYLVHFTPISNVRSILENGLLSRNSLSGKDYLFTDYFRSDGWLDWISLSVSFPNYKMFFAKKNSLKEVAGWAVLLIRKEVLWDLECKYVMTNAASSEVRMFRDNRWGSAEAFGEMFGFPEHRVGIPDFYTTDPQAEVMIKGAIPSRYIGVIAVEHQADANQLEEIEGAQVKVVPELFRWRSDFEHWRQLRLNPFSNDKAPLGVF